MKKKMVGVLIEGATMRDATSMLTVAALHASYENLWEGKKMKNEKKKEKM